MKFLTEKVCGGCGVLHQRSQFYPRKSSGVGSISHLCRECMKGYNKARDARRSDSGVQFAQNIKRHGITADTYMAILAAQGNACAACRITPEEFGQRLAVDHDHTCCHKTSRACGRCVRGLLCSSYNRALGQVRDSTETLAALISYLNNSRIGVAA